MGFAEEMKKKHAKVYKALLNHPFVQDIGNDSLPLKNFKFYMKQDYLFLLDYTHIFSLAVTKTPDLKIKGKFAELLDLTLNTELELHRSNAKKIGISRKELNKTELAPTTRAYIDHLLKVAYEGSLAEIISSLLPCQLGYWEIGKRLAKGEMPKQPIYEKWIKTYSSEEWGALADWLRILCNDLAKDARKDELTKMDNYFLLSSRYEYMFWEMSYKKEKWPI
ncbi:MAG TPA: thiaminase II [Nitrospinota bacterium]|nr:thiaminase II [Nitrospinota bacterium]